MFWNAALAGIVMLTASQAFAGCTSEDLDVKINTARRDSTGLPGQAYFDFMTECAASAPADVLQRARDWATSTGIYRSYQDYRDEQQAAANAAAQQALRDQQAIQRNRQEADRWILQMERDCRTGGYCDSDNRSIIEDYRRRHPDLAPLRLGEGNPGAPGHQNSGAPGPGGVKIDVQSEKVDPSVDLSDIRKRVLNLNH